MTPLRAAAVTALAAAAGADERLVLVGDGWLADAARGAFGARVVDVAGETARPWVAAGLAATGRRPVTVLADGAAVPTSLGVPGHRGAGAGQVVVTDDLAVADALLGAGVTVVQPAWPGDVGPLLSAALQADGDVVVRLHDGDAAPPAEAVAAPVPGRPRVLRSGGVLTLAASGALVGVLADVARMLAGRGAAVTAVDQHTFRPGRGVGLALYEGAIVVAGGEGGGALPDRVRRVPATGTPREVMDAVVAAVPALLAAHDDRARPDPHPGGAP